MCWLQVDDDDVVTLIDFPQMISVTHFNAKELFERDVDCVIRCSRAPYYTVVMHTVFLHRSSPCLSSLPTTIVQGIEVLRPYFYSWHVQAFLLVY